MGLINKSVLVFSKSLLKEIENSRKNPLSAQRKTFKYLLQNGADSAYGFENGFEDVIKNSYSYEEFKKRVPVKDYNQLQPYIDRIRNGEDYVLWNQKVKWFAKSSGTSAEKSKFIPITPDALWKCHYKGFLMLISSYLDMNPKSRLFNGKSLTLGGSVHLDDIRADGNSHGKNRNSGKETFSGDLSAILLRNSPGIAEWKRLPSRETALIPSFEEKLAKICKECSKQNVTNFAGVPSWNLIMIQKLLEYNGVDHLTDIWPNLELFMHGGISFSPYKSQYQNLIPKKEMYYIENYNASEGYFAFQDDFYDSGLLLTLTNGIFYEFIPMDDIADAQDGNFGWNDSMEGLGSKAVTLEGVKEGITYAMVISSNSGLWRYIIGDCVRFTSVSPHKIVIVGRTQMYINAFGEELMVGNAEQALSAACKKTGLAVSEYMVAPIYMQEGKRGGHQWAVELTAEAYSILERCEGAGSKEKCERNFAQILDEELCKCNSDYEAKRTESLTMDPIVLTIVPTGTFYRWMTSKGKIGGQNKVPRLSHERKHLEELLSFV